MYNSYWYISLNRPFLSPPDWIFLPIWIFLYILIFISLITFLQTKSKNKKLGYIYFFIQLFLNFSWAPTFFATKNIGGAFIIIVLLNIFIFLTIRYFLPISKFASYNLIPYFLWTLFALYLNFGYLILN